MKQDSPNPFTDLVKLTENKYNRLLFVLVIALLMIPFVGHIPISDSLIFLILMGVLLLTILLVIKDLQRGKKAFRRYLILAGLALGLQIVSQPNLLPSIAIRQLSNLSSVIFIYFLWVSISLILREIFQTATVTADTIKGGVCAYLLIGISWTLIYELIYQFDPDSFSRISSTHPAGSLVYFSFTTLTTVGYGDITPISPFARILANLEAVLGVMYPAIFIARLVALYRNEQKP